jgi:hypothetical protein
MNNKKTDERADLVFRIASIMEMQPPMMPLHAVRAQRDELYNVAERSSAGGWWITQTGFDAGKGSDFCKWEPKDATTNPAAALEVLKKCAEDLDARQSTNGIAISFAGGVWECVETDIFDGIRSEAPTLELAICRFAQQLFSK